MRTQTLASAFQSALTRTSPKRTVETAESRELPLLAALKRSATGLDEIVQRRIGLVAEGAGLTRH
jgi:hypothetical protein